MLRVKILMNIAKLCPETPSLPKEVVQMTKDLYMLILGEQLAEYLLQSDTGYFMKSLILGGCFMNCPLNLCIYLSSHLKQAVSWNQLF